MKIVKSLKHIILPILICSSLSAQEQIQRVKVTDLSLNETAPIVHGGALAQLLSELELESFENDTFPPPTGWSKITNFGGVGWQRAEAGSQITGFNQASVVDTTEGGGMGVALCSWATGDADKDPTTGQQTDQWLITPRIGNVQSGDSLTFYMKYFSIFGDSLDILISTQGDSIPDFTVVVDVLDFVGSGNNEWTKYSYSLTDFVAPGDSIYIAFREHVADTFAEGDALFLDLVEVSNLITSIDDASFLPDQFVLHQNYPNPFNPSTQITFSLQRQSKVSLKVFNLLGEVIANLIDGEAYAPGKHRLQFDAANLPNGIYYYRLEAGGFANVKKMTLLK